MNSENNISINWCEGAIPHSEIALVLAQMAQLNQTGAVDLFLGQIRADDKSGKITKAIHYTCYQPMAEQKFNEIASDAIGTFSLQHIVIFHSLGSVEVGGASLLVIVASGHRGEAFEGCREIVERIKKEVPIWGEEILEDGSQEWKVNS
jgi:molybdopterin synthase catalytic subunit